LLVVRKRRGLYDNAPSTSIQLLLDYKIAGQYLHPIVIDYLSNLRARSLLTTYDAVTDKLTHRPITVVCSGRCLLEDVLGQQPRDIFFDAPLDKLDSFQYGPEVSPLASASLKKLFGSWGSGDLNEGRMKKIRPMLESANMRGIKTRFYDGPTYVPTSTLSQVLELARSLHRHVFQIAIAGHHAFATLCGRSSNSQVSIL